MVNKTFLSEFFLMGFQNLHQYHALLLLLVLVVYLGTVIGNVLIFLLVSTNHSLQSPVNFFLGQLSLCDLLISTNVAPNSMHVILKNGSHISFQGCLIQLFFFGASAVIECSLLTVMSYDRYLAICNPLHYTSTMNFRLPCYLALWSWISGCICASITDLIVLQLKFCYKNVIDHFFCDLGPIIELSCSDPAVVRIEVSIVTLVFGLFQFFFIIVSYICILRSILQISSSLGRQKAFSTCSAHLTVVSIYYGTLIILYMIPGKSYVNLNKALSFLNTVVTPLFNPIIYSLRSTEIRRAMTKLLCLNAERYK
ncbi:olfactory receptor 6F1-like [Anomaloglossus baeobatrachus]|uniref:olfactory receptor 6F1-like n=1 Tax=Anomaloglossus baeobatrachus TaxID=238106 RepID=UPI003F4F83FE